LVMNENNNDQTSGADTQAEGADIRKDVQEPDEVEAAGAEEEQTSVEEPAPVENGSTEPAAEVAAPLPEGSEGESLSEEATAEETVVEIPDSASEADLDSQEDAGEEGSFAELYEESLERIQEGSVIMGRVVQITPDNVVVDIGAKSEGQISRQEFTDPQGELEVEVGDSVEVLLESSEDDEGGVRLSHSKAARIKVWETISEAYKEEGTIEGKIISRVKGGLSVDVGVQAFLPGSQIDLRPVRDMESYIGQTFDFKVLKYSKKRANVVLSRRVLLEEDRSGKKAELLKVLEENAVLDGVVKNITDYGAFIDLGGMDGLLHITDISWGRVGHPSERFSVGDEIKVKVLNFDQERERVSLGLKQLSPDPWTTVEEKYPIASRIEGKVVSLTDYGAFVELNEGVEGLVHVSEMSWTRKVRHPSKIVQIGDVVEAVVLNVDPERKRISLGMKQVMPDPWETIDDNYPVGTTIEGRIKSLTDFGVFIGIEDGIDGLVHISDLSWSKRVKHPSDLYGRGDTVKAMVLHIDKESRRFSLGIKQAAPDPWENAAQRYPVGSVAEGTITNVTDFGIFVEIEEGIEGLVHVSEVSKEKINTPVGQFNVGDKLSTRVVHLSPPERRIGLSIKRLEEEGAGAEGLREYTGPRQGATSNLGELILSQLKAEENS